MRMNNQSTDDRGNYICPVCAESIDEDENSSLVKGAELHTDCFKTLGSFRPFGTFF
jgi:hypothetical protein